MGSQLFYFFLPGPTPPHLRFSRAVECLSSRGMEFEEQVFCTPIDAEGLYTDVPREIALHERSGGLAVERASTPGTQIEASGSNAHIYMTCVFGSPHTTPLMGVGVPLKQWQTLSEIERGRHHSWLLEVGALTQSESIVAIPDPADDFMNRVLQVDGRWLIDLGADAGGPYLPTSAWLGPEATLECLSTITEAVYSAAHGYAEVWLKPSA